MKLWLVRHAQTDAAPGLCYGATDVGVPAEATLAVANAVVARLPAGAALAHSPLRRCAELALAIGTLRPDLVVRADARLAEMDFGAWEGRPWSSIARTEFDAWTCNFAEGLPGGHGESTAGFLQRTGAAFDDWRVSGQDAVWVTHAGVMRAVQLLHRGVRRVDNATQWPSEPIDYGACQLIECG
ncbi:histidine phosphatase family protein [Variovorax paradoxus]|uniref:histidine phosphatase family protein n=1 Tax=Variovorax paradoxus TaxID=34073 RepID=UPI00277DA10B|nr:histidine phosphatase family protein [Variovorax paradoxus]MDP9930992.1 alpha-ribazole phosphatase [Variovorax paradoxus]